MNYRVITYILGWVLNIEAAFMLMPFIVSLLYGEYSKGMAFVWVMLGSVAIGILLVIKKPKDATFYLKEGFVTVALSWIIMSVVGALPFVINGDIPHFVDAFFETVSGFTTTGASILSDVETLARCSMFWRCFTHWIGGMGVLVFLLAIVPMAGGTHMNLMKAESPGPSVGKIVPKVKNNAIFLYGIYIVMTIIMVIFLLAGDMSLYDSLCTAFGTAGTGGFGLHNDSFMSQSPYVQWVVTVFMILFGVNFGVYFLLITGRLKDAFKHEEARTYFTIIFAAAAIMYIDLRDIISGTGNAIRHIFFQIGSIMTTTGFASMDFDQWPETSRFVLVLLMFIGACAGSTGGGIKVARIIILFKTFIKEIISFLHPRSIKKVKVEGKVLEHETLRATNVYFFTFMLIFTLSMFLLTLEGKDMVTNFTAVAATLNNIGPGLSLVGPTGNFGFFSDFSKLVLSFDMLAGRLELFPLLLLFCPSVWKPKKKTAKV
ncbi:MAG: TrkH family potassium uptake protein [Lachnospiraceae bacterium]|nr:TrkH family potassium uptake protein [Lachnospiraceae bacterium]